jgi:hypothetical protein
MGAPRDVHEGRVVKVALELACVQSGAHDDQLEVSSATVKQLKVVTGISEGGYRLGLRLQMFFCLLAKYEQNPPKTFKTTKEKRKSLR